MSQEKIFCIVTTKNKLVSYNPSLDQYQILPRKYQLLKIWDYCNQEAIETWFHSQKQPPFQFEFKQIPTKTVKKYGFIK